MKKLQIVLTCFFAAALVLVVCSYSQASQKKITFKCQNTLPDAYVASDALARFAKQVSVKTNGHVEIIIYKTGQLFKYTDLPTALPSGAVELALPNLGVFDGIVPSLAAMSLVGPFDSAEHFYRCQEGKLGDLWAKDMQRANIFMVGYSSLGATDLITSPKKFIKSEEDFKGLKIQCATKGMQIFVETLGSIPTTLPVSDIYIGLERGTIDAIGSAGLSALSRKWYEFSKYMTKLIMNPEGPFAIAMNLNAWKSLPKNYQKIFLDSAREAWLWNRQQVKEQSAKAWKDLAQQKGVQVYEVPKEIQQRWGQAAERANHAYLEKNLGKEKSDQVFRLIDDAR